MPVRSRKPRGGPGYKVYTALLSQTLVSSTSGLLVVGKKYRITNKVGTDNFSNVGYVSDFVDFIATGTTPTVWTNATIVENQTDSAPTAIVLQDTINGNFIFVRNFAGNYELSSSVIFPQNKTFLFIGTGTDGKNFGFVRNSNSLISLFQYEGIGADGILFEAPVEIRVYP